MKPEVFILTPTYDGSVHVAYLLSVFEAMKDCEVKPVFSQGSLLTRNRNKMFLSALKSNAKYILFLDGDISIKTSQWLLKMINKLEENNADILGGIVPMKDNTQKASIAYDYGEFKTSLYSYEEIKKLSDLFQVDLIATGCMLIKVGDWLKDIKPPYFHMEDNIVNEEVLTFSEDWYFCRKAKTAGAKLLAWKGLEIEHFGSKSWSNKEIIK